MLEVFVCANWVLLSGANMLLTVVRCPIVVLGLVVLMAFAIGVVLFGIQPNGVSNG